MDGTVLNENISLLVFAYVSVVYLLHLFGGIINSQQATENNPSVKGDNGLKLSPMVFQKGSH